MSENEKKSGKASFNMNFFLKIIFTILIVIGIRTFILGTVGVKGSSMEPNFYHGDFVVVNKLAYYVGHPKKNDIAICRVDSGSSQENLIKRVIGLPGDKIELVENKDNYDLEYFLYINGELQEEPYIKEMMQQPGDIEYPYVVPENCYFVMGDNRNASTDSRAKSIGAIENKNMIGKVAMKIYPFGKGESDK